MESSILTGMFNLSKIVSVLYLFMIAAALVIYIIKTDNKSKASGLIAAYLAILLLTELLTTFVLPRKQPNHYVYAWSFLFAGMVLATYYAGIIRHKLVTLVLGISLVGYIIFFIKRQLWLPSTILKLEWIANFHFAFAMGALISLWFALRNGNTLSSKFLQKTIAALVVYHTIAIINISAIFSSQVIVNWETYNYFYWIVEAANLIFFAYMTNQLIHYRNKTASV